MSLELRTTPLKLITWALCARNVMAMQLNALLALPCVLVRQQHQRSVSNFRPWSTSPTLVKQLS